MSGRSEEERGFTVLLEEVRHEYRLLSERVTGLDERVEHGFKDLRSEMEGGFKDIKLGIQDFVKKLQAHRHRNGSGR